MAFLHPSDEITEQNLIFFSLSGGGYNNEVSGSLCPLFIGYFEDSHFMAPHYQSVVPVRDGSVLRMVPENDGLDVAMEIGLSGQFFPMCLKFFQNIKLNPNYFMYVL